MGELQPWSYWNQLTDTFTADYRPPDDPWNDCGNECVAMCVMFVHGVELPADYFRDRIDGEGSRGYMYTPGLVHALTRWGGVAAQQFDEDANATTGRICYAIDDGRPCVLLLRWTDDWNTGHFVCAIGYDSDNLYLADPYGGYRRVMPWGDFGNWYKGEGIEVLMHRHPELGQ